MNIINWFKSLFGDYSFISMLIYKGDLFVMSKKSILRYDNKTKEWTLVKDIKDIKKCTTIGK